MQCPHCFREVNTNGACPYCGYDGTDAAKRFPQALKPGSILNGRYIVGRVLGQGGFGITYIAWDDNMKERVAIKEYFPAEFAGRTGISVQVHSENQAENFAYGKAQFLEEAKTLAAFIGCPGIVRIYSYFEENGTAYMTMEYVDGPPLNKYMAAKGGRLTTDGADRLLLPLMESLETVHAKGIVHRDIAPDNILVTSDGTAKLIDFGAARYSTGEKSRSLDVILKHGFAPYEQYMRRGRQGPWTDVYALAATYYYAITGKVPPEAVERKEEDTLVPPSTLGVKISPAQEDVLLKAMEVSANERIQSMGDFRRAMLEASGGQTAPKPKQTPKPTPKTQPKPVPEAPAAHTPAAETRPGKKRSLLPLILGAAAVLAVLLFFVFGGKGSESAKTRIGMVTDIGGVNDKSFNQTTWEGLQALADEDASFEVNYLESKTDADYQTNINTFIDEGYDLVICVGFMLADATRDAAEANPDQKFAIIDDSSCADLPNVACLMFSQEQASYLVGLVAGYATQTKTVGYVQGMVSDSMNLYGIGYITGVLEACPGATVLQYNANNFADIVAGSTAAKDMIKKGADVIYHAAGATGLGVIEACSEEGIWAIGVDTDQSDLAPDHVITSAMKRVDIASQSIARTVKDGTYSGGIHMYDLSNGGVDLAPSRDHIPADILKKVEAAKAAVISGKKTVPTRSDGCPAFALG